MERPQDDGSERVRDGLGKWNSKRTARSRFQAAPSKIGGQSRRSIEDRELQWEGHPWATSIQNRIVAMETGRREDEALHAIAAELPRLGPLKLVGANILEQAQGGSGAQAVAVVRCGCRGKGSAMAVIGAMTQYLIFRRPRFVFACQFCVKQKKHNRISQDETDRQHIAMTSQWKWGRGKVPLCRCSGGVTCDPLGSTFMWFKSGWDL
ncbi:hypothetical protein C8R45DRAFT_928963 [Mycena sanguinolenta]|nr:hypothetical protein C8R45DRAFT_928963 [Mycena sanguinolenta]